MTSYGQHWNIGLLNLQLQSSYIFVIELLAVDLYYFLAWKHILSAVQILQCGHWIVKTAQQIGSVTMNYCALSLLLGELIQVFIWMICEWRLFIRLVFVNLIQKLFQKVFLMFNLKRSFCSRRNIIQKRFWSTFCFASKEM